MAISTVEFSEHFAEHMDDRIATSMRNFADITRIEMQKRAPFLNGGLVHGMTVVVRDPMHIQIVDSVPYAILRNFENNLHPQTKHYVEQGVRLAKSGDKKKWWKSIV